MGSSPAPLESWLVASFADALGVVESLKQHGLVREYAVAGAMAIVFWTEPVPTLGEYRVYFEVQDEPERIVKVVAVGRKVRERVLIGGVEVKLR